MRNAIRYVRSDIEDLAFTSRSSRVSDGKKTEDGDAVLSTTFTMNKRAEQTWEQRIKEKGLLLRCGVQSRRERR